MVWKLNRVAYAVTEGEHCVAGMKELRLQWFCRMRQDIIAVSPPRVTMNVHHQMMRGDIAAAYQ